MQPVELAEQIQAQDEANPKRRVSLCFVARDGRRMQKMSELLKRLMPSHKVLTFPAWDCLPYDRVSPNASVLAERMTTLAALRDPSNTGAIVITTVNAIIQKTVSTQFVDQFSFSVTSGQSVETDRITNWANVNGYMRVPTVREPGEFAVRGGLIDLFPAGFDNPLRFDFFGSSLESIRTFDPETQRTISQQKSASMVPMGEIVLQDDTISQFRRGYTASFGGNTANDPLYAAISAGQRFAGMEHWLPLFYNNEMGGLPDFLDGAPLVLDEQVNQAIAERLTQIQDYYAARKEAYEEGEAGAVYKPLPAEHLYFLGDELALSQSADVVQITPFSTLDHGLLSNENRDGQLAPNFRKERQAENINLFEAVIETAKDRAKNKKLVTIACWTEGTRDRMAQVLKDHEITATRLLEHWGQVKNLNLGEVGLIVLGLESGFETKDLLVISEQDILGERIIRSTRRRKGAEALTEATGLASGDLVVHVDHGIGRFVGLKAIDVMGAPHDCVEIAYAKNDRLYLPVENIELLSRYGSDAGDGILDKLGGVAWQAKKAKLKQRIREMAEQLIQIAAARAMSKGEVVEPQMGLYEEFCARFPYEETEDQLTAIEAIFDDLAAGKVMDRLVCGDVGFGKTEVALRAAFAVALSGKQVAIVVPTTLLARQHFKTFSERFADLPVNVRQASRLVTAKELKLTKEGLTSGNVDIVIGTHALLAKTIKFKDLGLLVVDEEQHFGVGHKERLKELKANVHVLTLSATPIPRTLQMALTGVRDLSLLATAPVDRLSVRSFVLPFDPLVVREALLREKYRGGQSFYVVPRIKDQGGIVQFLQEQVPEVSFVVANGQMAPGELDDIMNAFYDGKFDVLIATTIVESGLDIPTANTLVVHRADNFGLSQLHQIRGRIGRSKVRAYALFTTPTHQKLTDMATRRLTVLQSLDSLGAGFQLASHDLDIRGAGNILGEEQSGHIREVGYELYQAMLEEAVATLKSGGNLDEEDGQWSPQISLGMPVMIPEAYVPDLQVRMQLYRRLGDLTESEEINAFGAELIDRFGPLPEEVQHLLKIVLVKSLCRTANVEKVDAGPKGAVITLRNGVFPNPHALVQMIADPGERAKVRPDQKLVFSRNWPDANKKLMGAARILSQLAKLAQTDA
ncbi:transcription-repair coupling factor [Maritalea sp.]|uniref:transcription-repair coupling factor n=1 Tax=Maritalea sp. TaxID=2003361 RepID=UPI003EF65561